MNNKKLNLAKCFFVAFVLFFAQPVFADYSRLNIIDSTSIRELIFDSWLTAPMPDVRNKKPEIVYDHNGFKFQVRAERTGNEVAIIVVPCFVDQKDSYVYPATVPGTWILYRDAKNGKPLRIRILFNTDSDVYIELQNGESKTYADIVLFGCYASRSVPIGVSFTTLYTTTFDDIVDATKTTLAWDKVIAIPGQYQTVTDMIATIRERLQYIDYAEDACYNENKELYSIETNEPYVFATKKDELSIEEIALQNDYKEARRLLLSNAGFIKWVTDGIIRSYGGELTKIDNMLNPTINFNSLGKNGVTSQNWNMSFTLDWCRNLAVEALNSISSRASYTYKMGIEDKTGVDVEVKPFVSEVVNGKIVRTTGYTKDTGYSLRELKALLYVLAVTEPRNVYYAAIKQYSEQKSNEFVFSSCVLLTPYFTDDGRFECRVFASGIEVSLDSFLAEQKNAYIHLERVKALENFRPF